MEMDTLSETLLRMRLKSSVASMIDAGGRWAVAVPEYEGFNVSMVLQGEKWMTIKGQAQPYRLRAGDCLLMTAGKPFVSTSDLSVRRKTPVADLAKTETRGVMTLNGGGDCLSVATLFQFEGHLSKIIFARLPDAMHIPAHVEQAAVLRWSLEQFRTEILGNQLGRSLVLNHLAPIMLAQILRIYLAGATDDRNWLKALGDAKLSKAIGAMHADYGQPWSLEKLAAVAGMSRSRFALHFKRQVGVSPMDYLMHWRVQIACELLKSPEQSVGTVATAVGYASVSAFSAAFHKVIKCRPGHYQKALLQ